MRDGLEAVSSRAGFFLCVNVDVSAVQQLMVAYRRLGRHVTYTHVAVKVCADLLARHPEHHRFVANNQKLRPGRVDIGVSVAADQPLAPILVIEAADRKSLAEISEEVERRAPEVRTQFCSTVAQWNKWGWLVPFSVLRRMILSLAASSLNARRKGGGTFQITNLPCADIFVPLLLGGVSALGMGRVSEQVAVYQGQVVIRPMITLGFSVDLPRTDAFFQRCCMLRMNTAVTDEEVRYIAGKIDAMPAGADGAGLLLLILIIAVIWWAWKR